MKKLGLLLLILVSVGFLALFSFKFVKEKVRKDLNQPVSYPSVTIAPTLKVNKKQDEKTSLFVPYWTLKHEIAGDYDEFIYFGVTPGIAGIDKSDAGYSNIDTFLELVPQGSKKLLTLRMIDRERNFATLKDPSLHKKVISDTIALSKEHGFEGIALDLELSAIPFDSLIQQINAFTKLFYQQAKKNNLQFSIVIYGDTFYRIRPFDVKALSSNSDRIFIMAYDFHKSKGNPGPNFPLGGKDEYGYDLAKMTDNFLEFVPARKTTVIFGLFGYDWIVDNKGKSLGNGGPLTYAEIKDEFIGNCLYTNCSIKGDKKSAETEIRYTDAEDRDHIIWFEDMESVAAKKKYLKERGISSFSFWANSYF